MRYTALFFKDGILRESAIPLIQELLREKVQVDQDGCWIWQEHLSPQGYGYTALGGYDGLAHRLSFRVFKGPIPKGLFVMHACDKPACIRPDCLSADTHKANMADMVAKGRSKRGHTHCQNGHEYTEANTGWVGGKRVCRACHKMASREYARHKRESDPEAARAQVQQWREANRERFNARARVYRRREVRRRLGLDPNDPTDLRGRWKRNG